MALQNTTVDSRTPNEAEHKLEGVFEAVGEGQKAMKISWSGWKWCPNRCWTEAIAKTIIG